MRAMGSRFSAKLTGLSSSHHARNKPWAGAEVILQEEHRKRKAIDPQRPQRPIRLDPGSRQDPVVDD